MNALLAPRFYKADAYDGHVGYCGLLEPHCWPYAMVTTMRGLSNAPTHKLVPITRAEYYAALAKINKGFWWNGFFRLHG